MTGRIFIKHAPSTASASSEAEGLQALSALLSKARICGLKTPAIVAQDASQLQLSLIDTQKGSEQQWREAGIGLAQLHSQPVEKFGWVSDNFIGLSPQLNCWSDNWGQFFVDYRLRPQLRWMANGTEAKLFRATLDRHERRLVEYFNSLPLAPSLVHGDLWSGNLLFDQSSAWLIDPAVYHADAEVDIAMSRLFGGFEPSFYEAYRRLRPAPNDVERRHQLYNLYHALNHANLFGSSYLGLCRQGFEVMETI